MKKTKSIDPGYRDEFGQIMHMPFDKLEAAFRARRRIHVLQRCIDREQDRLSRAQTAIQKFSVEMKKLLEEYK